jgi:hypothetical protein
MLTRLRVKVRVVKALYIHQSGFDMTTKPQVDIAYAYLIGG